MMASQRIAPVDSYQLNSINRNRHQQAMLASRRNAQLDSYQPNPINRYQHQGRRVAGACKPNTQTFVKPQFLPNDSGIGNCHTDDKGEMFWFIPPQEHYRGIAQRPPGSPFPTANTVASPVYGLEAPEPSFGNSWESRCASQEASAGDNASAIPNDDLRDSGFVSSHTRSFPPKQKPMEHPNLEAFQLNDAMRRKITEQKALSAPGSDSDKFHKTGSPLHCNNKAETTKPEQNARFPQGIAHSRKHGTYPSGSSQSSTGLNDERRIQKPEGMLRKDPPLLGPISDTQMWDPVYYQDPFKRYQEALSAPHPAVPNTYPSSFEFKASKGDEPNVGEVGSINASVEEITTPKRKVELETPKHKFMDAVALSSTIAQMETASTLLRYLAALSAQCDAVGDLIRGLSISSRWSRTSKQEKIALTEMKIIDARIIEVIDKLIDPGQDPLWGLDLDRVKTSYGELCTKLDNLGLTLVKLSRDPKLGPRWKKLKDGKLKLMVTLQEINRDLPRMIDVAQWHIYGEKSLYVKVGKPYNAVQKFIIAMETWQKLDTRASLFGGASK